MTATATNPPATAAAVVLDQALAVRRRFSVGLGARVAILAGAREEVVADGAEGGQVDGMNGVDDDHE